MTTQTQKTKAKGTRDEDQDDSLIKTTPVIKTTSVTKTAPVQKAKSRSDAARRPKSRAATASCWNTCRW